MGAFDVRRGKPFGFPSHTHDSELLDLIEAVDPPGRGHIIMDNLSAHDTSEVNEWFDEHPRWTRLRSQLETAAMSVPLNIAEGSGKPSPADRAHAHAIARGSAMERGAIVDVCAIAGYISAADAWPLRSAQRKGDEDEVLAASVAVGA